MNFGFSEIDYKYIYIYLFFFFKKTLILLQIGYLIKTKWANRLKFNISKDKKTLQLFYWM